MMYKENLDNELALRVKKALDKIRPFLVQDGGDVSLVEITADNVVVVRLLGACSTCNLNLSTLKAGVESTVKREVPEIVRVENVDDMKN